MRGYEVVFIFNPSLNEEERMKLVEKIEKIISTSGVLHETNYWGKKRFAYPIQKFTDGHFYLFVFDGEATIPYDLKRLTKVTETILRSLVIVRKTLYRAKDVPAPVEAKAFTMDVPKESFETVLTNEDIAPEEPIPAEEILEEVKIEETNAE